MALNLTAVLLLLAAISIWIYLYTGTTPVFWVSLVVNFYNLTNVLFKVLPDSRIKILTRAFDRKVIQYSRTWIIVVILGLVLFVTAANFGSIELISTEAEARGAEFSYPAQGEDMNRAGGGAILAYGKAKFLLRAGIRHPRIYRVHVSKLPTVTQGLRSFGRPPLMIPASFSRRAVLAFPLPWLGETIRNHAYDLRVSIRHKREATRVHTWEKYQGELVWIGVSSDLSIPEYAKAVLRTKMGDDPEVLDTPLSIAPNLILEPNDWIRIEVREKGCDLRPGCKPYIERDLLVSERTLDLVELG